MRHTLSITIVVAVALVFSSAALGESASVLLEKGIFKEETAGDLNEAIKIYKQIVADAKANRRYVAEAHYRLGICHLKKGDKAKAAGQFRQVIRFYRDQKALVVKAEAQLAKLAPPPSIQAARFGAVIERVITDIDETNANQLLDFETGKLFTLPDGFGELKERQRAEWMVKRGIDVLVDQASNRWALGGYDFVAASMGRASWEVIRPADVREKLAAGEPGVKTITRGRARWYFVSRGTILAFKTREGAMGVLQIVGFTDKPRGVKIRYKLLKHGPEFLPLNKVVERTVYYAGSGREFLIDIDTGKVFGPHALEGMAKGAESAFCVKTGIDAGAEISRRGPGLWGIDMIAIPMATEPIEKITLLGIRYDIAIGKPGTPAIMSAIGKLPRMYAFKTREGSMGVLQIIEVVSKKPSHIKIRYKLLKHGPATSANTAPRVVKISPAAFADDVDPSLDKITVTFDRPMMDKRWSFTGGDKVFSEKTGTIFPKRTGEISYDAARTTCTMPVKLQPGKVYWVGVNSPRFQNFKSANGVPAKQYVILFATKSADGRPTPPGKVDKGRVVGGGTNIDFVAPADGIVYLYNHGKLALTKSLKKGERVQWLGTVQISKTDFWVLSDNARLYFKPTEAAAEGKPTPLPQDLVKQAKEINATSTSQTSGADKRVTLENQGLVDFDTGATSSIKHEHDFPKAYDLSWNHYLGGVFLICPQGFEKCIPLKEASTMDQAVALAQQRTAQLAGSGESKRFDPRSAGYFAVVTDRMRVAVVHVEQFDAKGAATISWRIAPVLTDAMASPEAIRANETMARTFKLAVEAVAQGDRRGAARLIMTSLITTGRAEPFVTIGLCAPEALKPAVIRSMMLLEGIEPWQRNQAGGESVLAGVISELAAVCEGLNRYDEAAKYYQVWLQLNPKSADAKAALIRTLQAAEAVSVADKWVSLVDSGKYAASWDQAAEYFKAAVTKQKWAVSVKTVRAPLGKVKSRKLLSAKYTTSLPGAPDGKYVVIQYQTSFENKKNAVETITPMKDKDGKWRVSGYYIK